MKVFHGLMKECVCSERLWRLIFCQSLTPPALVWWTLYYPLYLHVSWSFMTWRQDRAVLKLHSDCLGKTWLRSRIASTVQSTSIPNNNLTKDEQQALKRMQNDTNIVILLADKGRVTVVMEKADYFDKMDTLLNLNLNIISSATSRGHHANSETLKW